jgi:hypothetical protein
MSRRTVVLLMVLPLFVALPARANEKVALRAVNGRFLRVSDDGVLRAVSFLPTDKETFELVSRGKQEIALKGPGGRYLVPDARDSRALRLGAALTEPGDRETFRLVPAGVDRFALYPHGSGALPGVDAAAARPPQSKTPAGPPREAVEIYRVRPLPAVLHTALSATTQALAAKELAGKPYDKTRTHQTKKYVELPDPTLKDLTRMKRHQVIGVTEEYRVQAQLDGEADIRFPAMLFLASYAEDGPSVILLAVDASLPVRGHVQYQVHDVVSASTGYRATIQLSAVAEARLQRSGGDVALGPCTVLDLHASLSRLDFSNDLLDAVRRQIKDFINHELGRNEERLRQSANQSLQKAISSHAVRIPLFGYLGLL